MKEMLRQKKGYYYVTQGAKVKVKLNLKITNASIYTTKKITNVKITK